MEFGVIVKSNSGLDGPSIQRDLDSVTPYSTQSYPTKGNMFLLVAFSRESALNDLKQNPYHQDIACFCGRNIFKRKADFVPGSPSVPSLFPPGWK